MADRACFHGGPTVTKRRESPRTAGQDGSCPHTSHVRASDDQAHPKGPSAPRSPRRHRALVVEFFQDRRGSPYERWYGGLPESAQSWIESKLLRLSKSPELLLSATKRLGDGLRELRHRGKGPGYRVYLTVIGDRLIILGGGVKSGQAKDVNDARQRLHGLRYQEGRHAQADHRPNGQQP